MTDISHSFGQDIDQDATGDFLSITGDAETGQRIVKRIMTNSGDYIWQLAYGAGLGGMVGGTDSILAITNVVRSQIFVEQTVAQVPEPVVTVAAGENGVVNITIIYKSIATGLTQTVTLTLGN